MHSYKKQNLPHQAHPPPWPAVRASFCRKKDQAHQPPWPVVQGTLLKRQWAKTFHLWDDCIQNLREDRTKQKRTLLLSSDMYPLRTARKQGALEGLLADLIGRVGIKNERGFDVCGSVGRFRLTCWKSKQKVCRYVSREIYVCHIKSVPKVIGVLTPTNLLFCEQSWYPITSSRRLLVKVGV